jgi:glucosyl-dolichyl phosphate glucuronosyltransferase
MRFSVVICTHNRSHSLQHTLEVLGQQDVPGEQDWEIVVVDNASQDDTPQVVEAYQRCSPVAVHYVRESRLGHSYALNTGVAASRGEIIAFTDDDAEPCPIWLRELDRMFREYQADLAFGKVYPVWEQESPHWFSDRFNPFFALLDYGPEIFVVDDVHKPFYGVNHAIKRSTLKSLGGYREDLGLRGNTGGIGNDLDLFQRALAANLRVLYNPTASVGHIIESCRYRKSYWRKKTWQSAKHQVALVRANPPPVPLLLGLPRFYYRYAFDYLMSYLKGFFIRDRSLFFYHELRLIRFLGLIYQNCRRPAAARTLSQ